MALRDGPASVRQLERAIRAGTSYAFETTFGDRSITRSLLGAAAQGRSVRIWYVGLASPELHMKDGEIEWVADPRTVPAWSKPIIQAALSA